MGEAASMPSAAAAADAALKLLSPSRDPALVFFPTVSPSSLVGGDSWRSWVGLSGSVKAAEDDAEVRSVEAEGAEESDNCVEVVEMEVNDAPGLLALLLLFVDARFPEDGAEEGFDATIVCASARSSLDVSAEEDSAAFCLPLSMSISPARVRSYSSRLIPAARARSMADCWADSVP